jgi:uncharacterized membrane protein YoaK (UPF0700 family)
VTDEPDAANTGPTVLVVVLVVMTFVTGIVDAVAFLRLDHVFVGNMTGNVVFIGFAVAGAPGFSASASLVALASFVSGAVLVGWLSRPAPRGVLAPFVTGEAVLCAVGSAVAATADGTTVRYAVTALLAVAMGGQAAIVRRLAVPDMSTTNVVTSTLTALVSEHPDLGGWGSHAVRRAALVAAMLIGALVGALLTLHTSTAWALATAAAILAAVVVVHLAGARIEK